jgi:hypothetical protein
MVKKLKIMENEKQTHLGYEICQGSSEKHEKKINTHCRNWIMAIKLKNVENEKHTL